MKYENLGSNTFMANYLKNFEITADKLIEAIRDHWKTEFELHWSLDIILDENHSRNRVQSSINNLSIMRKIVFNLASLDNNFFKVPL